MIQGGDFVNVSTCTSLVINVCVCMCRRGLQWLDNALCWHRSWCSMTPGSFLWSTSCHENSRSRKMFLSSTPWWTCELQHIYSFERVDFSFSSTILGVVCTLCRVMELVSAASTGARLPMRISEWSIRHLVFCPWYVCPSLSCSVLGILLNPGRFCLLGLQPNQDRLFLCH